MDALDFYHIHSHEVLTGTYYNIRPKTDASHGVEFSYDIVDAPDRSYANLIETLHTDKTVSTIKTSDKVDFKVKGYVRTQDGLLWTISGFIKHPISERKQALRILKETVDTEYVLRLIEVDNPMGLK